jgi:single-stranded-DNA-specific exonuclease
VGAADLGARLLSTADPLEAASIARQLDGFNTERRQIEENVLTEAMAQAEAKITPGLVFVSAEGWHAGVIGIVASRLKERYGRPACVVALGEGVGKGSGRSVAGIDLGNAVIAARQAALLVNGGGHPMAAGFTVEAGKLEPLREFLAERLGAGLEGERPQATLDLDAALQPGGATSDLLRQIERLGPFGSGNPEPRFAITAARIVRADPAGEAHVRCIISGADGGRLKAIAFRSLENELGRALLQRAGPALHLAGHLRADRWQGRDDVQLLIDDAAVAA